MNRFLIETMVRVVTEGRIGDIAWDLVRGSRAVFAGAGGEPERVGLQWRAAKQLLPISPRLRNLQ